jgi:hypothetical protein
MLQNSNRVRALQRLQQQLLCRLTYMYSRVISSLSDNCGGLERSTGGGGRTCSQVLWGCTQTINKDSRCTIHNAVQM